MSIADEIITVLVLRGQERVRHEVGKVSKEVLGLGTSSEKAEVKSRGAFGKMGHGLATLGKTFLRVGAIATAAIGVGIAAAFAAGLKSVTEFQKAAAQTNAVLRSTHGVANVTADDVERLSHKVSGYSKFSDIAARQGLNMLLTFRNIRNEVGKGNDIFNQASSSLFDLAQHLGGDPAKQAIRLGKALNDPVKGVVALRRVGIQFTESQQKQIKALVESGHMLEAQRIILREVNTEFGGSAKAVGKTFYGALERTKHALEEMMRGFAAPAMGKFADGLVWINEHVLPKLQKSLQGVSNWFSIITQGKTHGVPTGRFAGIQRDAADFFRVLWHGEPAVGAIETKATRLAMTVRKVVGGAFKAAKTVLHDTVTYIKTGVIPTIKNLSAFLSPDLSQAAHIVGVLLKFGLGVALKVIGGLFKAVGATLRGVTGFMNKHKIAVKTLAIMVGIMTAAIMANRISMMVNLLVLKGLYIYARIAATAQKAMAAATWLVNAAMDANPIVLVVAAIVALAVGFIYAYKHSEKFRKIVTGAFKAVKNAALAVWHWFKSNWPYLLAILMGPFGLAVGYIIKHWRQVVGFFKKAPHEIKAAFSKLGGWIMAPFKWAFNEVAKLWDATMGRIHFKVPSWVPHFGGKGWGFPMIHGLGGSGSVTNTVTGAAIPKAHAGGDVKASGMVNFRPDEEIVWMPKGARVDPLTVPQGQQGADGGTKIIQLVVGRKVLAQAVYDETSSRVARS